WRQGAQRGDELVLDRRGSVVEDAAALAREREAQAAVVVARVDSDDEAALDQALHDDRDRALVREGERGELVERQAGVLRQALQRKDVRARQPLPSAARRGMPQRLDDPAQRVERLADVGSGRRRAPCGGATRRARFRLHATIL